MVTWFNRGTLHLVRSEDYSWLHTLTAPLNRTTSDTRLRQSGVSAAAANRGMQLIEKSLADEGPLTSAALRERLAGGRVPTAGYAFGHLLFLASQRGLIVRGPCPGASIATSSCMTGSARSRLSTAIPRWRSLRDATLRDMGWRTTATWPRMRQASPCATPARG